MRRAAAASADALATQQRAYARLDASIRPERFVVPDITGPQTRTAARRAGIDWTAGWRATDDTTADRPPAGPVGADW